MCALTFPLIFPSLPAQITASLLAFFKPPPKTKTKMQHDADNFPPYEEEGGGAGASSSAAAGSKKGRPPADSFEELPEEEQEIARLQIEKVKNAAKLRVAKKKAGGGKGKRGREEEEEEEEQEEEEEEVCVCRSARACL